MKNWIRGELLELTHDEVFSSRLIGEHLRREALERLWREHQARRHNHAHLFWTLLNLALWERLLLHGEVAADSGAPAFPAAAAMHSARRSLLEAGS